MIIIDDGSPDGTLEVAKDLQRIYGSDKIVGEKQTKQCLRVFSYGTIAHTIMYTCLM